MQHLDRDRSQRLAPGDRCSLLTRAALAAVVLGLSYAGPAHAQDFGDAGLADVLAPCDGDHAYPESIAG